MFDRHINLSDFLHEEKNPLLFHTGFFLLVFSVFLIIYSFVINKPKIRSVLLISFGFYFYYKSSGVFLLLLLLTITFDYLFCILIEKQKNPNQRKFLFFASILFSLSFLLYFKYRNFFVSNYNEVSGHSFPVFDLIIPVGISFYTFQSISFLTDIYLNKIPRPKFSDYLLYMTFFPHLVAGPIVRAKDFIPQLKENIRVSAENLNEAFYLITKGFLKKAIIADYVAQYSDIVFSSPQGFSGTEQGLAAICYTLQIFCDFSGYTDMAIGIALLLGYKLCLNFDSPYKSVNITDFWRRWHISLSSWLRDYVYIPLGGNKKGFLLKLLFLLLTMLIGGFWHGADWKFIFWGGAHGVLLISHNLFIRFTKKISFPKWTNLFFWLLTFISVTLLWIPFRAQSFNDAMIFYSGIFSSHKLQILSAIMQINPLLIVLLVFGFGFAILNHKWKNTIKEWYWRSAFAIKFLTLTAMILVMLMLNHTEVQPFIYFQF